MLQADQTASAEDMHRVVDADAVKWGPSPPGLPKGAEVAVLSGDPGKPVLFILRVRLPDGYVVPPHWHSRAEHVTTLSGRMHIGMGDKLDRSKGQVMEPGAFTSFPAKMHHYVWASGETVIQVSGMGPFDINYIDPNDDPRKATSGAR
jgi:quercetin dioxygenase-like cupin family protein